uniref:Reverse transcriptase zinc-binding domain-containing protein n=1 Tax=Cajanus cajan TaxID=3821 RepID=A0A151STD1_CAJCA|nr:hypothetical protein KK1_004308 [Cajanus cajan]
MVFRSLLQYANATIFVGEASWKNVWATKSVLQLFELVAGLKVNFHKSKLLGANIDLEILGPMANFLNCKVGHFSCSYLGLFIGANTNRLSTWKRLTKWKGKLLSFGGTLVLLKFVLNSIPIYFLSFGVRDLRSFNLALLGKWRWSFLVERDCLWIKVVTSIYGAMTSLNRRGGRRRVSRWWDSWCTTKPFCERYTRLFSIFNNKEMFMADMRVCREGEYGWNWCWRWQLFQWEQSQLSLLMLDLTCVQMNDTNDDSWKWSTDPRGLYSVKSTYYVIVNASIFAEISLHKFIWCRLVPSKVSCFAWKVMLDRIPTKVNLVEEFVIVFKFWMCAV